MKFKSEEKISSYSKESICTSICMKIESHKIGMARIVEHTTMLRRNWNAETFAKYVIYFEWGQISSEILLMIKLSMKLINFSDFANFIEFLSLKWVGLSLRLSDFSLSLWVYKAHQRYPEFLIATSFALFWCLHTDIIKLHSNTLNEKINQQPHTSSIWAVLYMELLRRRIDIDTLKKRSS